MQCIFMYSLVSHFFPISIHYLQCIHCLLHTLDPLAVKHLDNIPDRSSHFTIWNYTGGLALQLSRIVRVPSESNIQYLQIFLPFVALDSSLRLSPSKTCEPPIKVDEIRTRLVKCITSDKRGRKEMFFKGGTNSTKNYKKIRPWWLGAWVLVS